MTWREMLDALEKAQAEGKPTTPRVIYPKADEQKTKLRLLEKDA